MTATIDDVSGLPGRTVHDQEKRSIGKVEHVYAVGGDGQTVWVGVKASFGMFDKRQIIIPLARMKEEDGDLVVPYSLDHIKATPEVEGDEIGEADDRRLRDHYSIDAGDQELRDDNLSYATLVPDEAGTAKRVEDPSSLETPDPDKRTDDTYERLKDAGPAETRDVDAGEIANELTTNQNNSEDGAGEKQNEGSAGNEGTGEEGGEDTRESRSAEEPVAAPDAKRERSGG